MTYYSSGEFYRSKEWQDFRTAVMFERTNERGEIICEECGRPIVLPYDCIAHHVRELTVENLNDCNTTLNPDNIQLLHARCHNIRHSRFGFCKMKKVFLVYGCPFSGKTTYVKSIAGMNDIKLDMDDIYSAISFNPDYMKPGSISDVAFSIRDSLYQTIKMRRGKWQTAYVIGGYPFKGERERIAAELGAEEIFIECDKDTALHRLECCNDGRNVKEFTEYIEKWFDRFSQ